VVTYEPVGDRVEFVADLAVHWATLRRTPVSDRRVALILANYPNRDGRLANGVGLDTPQSAIEVLHALKAAGYTLGDIPTDGDDLIRQLTAGVTNDPEGRDFRQIRQALSLNDYHQHFETLPEAVRAGMSARWGLPGGDGEGKEDGEAGEETQISPLETPRVGIASPEDLQSSKLKTQNSSSRHSTRQHLHWRSAQPGL
jgi:cobalamin biosynthesis Mg chelatase CobN